VDLRGFAESPLTDSETLAHHVELLHRYHLDLWNEIEAQLHVLRGAQDQIAKLREARLTPESKTTTRDAAELLARHVGTLKGRVATLGSTVEQLGNTVGELVTVLSR
jgi:hypothetical protein